jgi:hypothetical protein
MSYVLANEQHFVQWGKSTDGMWCQLNGVDLTSPALNVTGNYIVWFGAPGHNVLRVGQGNIGERLADHKSNPKIQAYKSRGLLLFTWATVPNNKLNGVELYLARHYTPLEGERYPNVTPITVNLPVNN